MTRDPTLLRAGAAEPTDDALLDADPTGAWGTLVRLRRDAVDDAPAAHPVPDLPAIERWAGGAEDDAVAWHAERSVLLAEIVEAALDALPADAHRELAAAPATTEVADPWPARYGGDGWVVVLGVDEAGWLYWAIEATPAGAETGDGELVLDDVGLTVPVRLVPGAAGGIEPAADLFGADDVNPVRTIQIGGARLSRSGR